MYLYTIHNIYLDIAKFIYQKALQVRMEGVNNISLLSNKLLNMLNMLTMTHWHCRMKVRKKKRLQYLIQFGP